jgi:hypothetical protein
MSTTTTRSAKLYSSLTPIQLARIAKGYLAKQDSAELQRIVDALPTYTYRAPSHDFFRAINTTHDIAMMASIYYWRAASKQIAAHGLAIDAADNEPAKLGAAIERLKSATGELNAIIAAWHGICERMGWDMEALSQIALMPIHPPPAEYNETAKAEHLEAWQSVLDAAGMVAA